MKNFESRNKIIGIIGSGWRAEGWLKVISAIDRLGAVVLVRNQEKAQLVSSLGGEPVFTEEELLCRDPALVLVCVSKAENYLVCKRLEGKALLLCETPAGVTSEERNAFRALKRVYLAEQYYLQPRFQAISALVASGALGEVNTVMLSCCHDYHAVSLFRKLLGTGETRPIVRAIRFNDPYTEHGGRRGDIPPVLQDHGRVLAVLSYDNKQGIYDFSQAQYFSDIRSPRIVIQGTKGELIDGHGYRIEGSNRIPFELHARYGGRGGKLDAPDLLDIVCEGKVLYRNRFTGLRFSDEEIAMAECLIKALSGEGYSVQEGALDAETAAQFENI